MRRTIQRLLPRQRLAVLVVVLLGLVAGLNVHAPVAHAADCNDNSIINCGFSGAGPGTINQHFIEKVKANDSGNGYHDLINVYNSYGLDSSKYDEFVAYARQGQTYKNGKIIVDGRVVATDSNSIGRLKSYQGNGPFAKTISGRTFWGNTNDQAFLSDPLPVTVLFNNRGEAMFAVINSCGNPMGFTPVKTTYSCTNLEAHQVPNHPDTYNFKTNADAGNGAKIEKLVYDFGDGKTATSYDVNQTVTHVYTESSSYHASVKIYVSLPFGHSDIINGAETGCATVIKVQLPVYACLQLLTSSIPDKRFTYQFVVKSQTLYGATLKGANFTFGDGTTAAGVSRANSSTVSTTHAYQKDGKYNVTASVIIQLPNGTTTTATSAHCVATIKAAEYGCIQLTGELLDTPLAYHFIVTANATPKIATFLSADFDFGDGVVKKGVTPANLTATVDHTYAVDNNYTVTATLHFKDSSKAGIQDDKCTAAVSKTVTPECRPGVPQGSMLCSPCQYNNALPSDSPQCVGTLPNTGAGDVIGIAGVTALVGFFFYRQFIYRKHVFHSDNDAINMLLGEKATHKAVKHEMTTHNAHHRNKQPLSHATYQRPHRFRPRSHGEK